MEGDCFDLSAHRRQPRAAAPSVEIFLPLPATFVFLDGKRHLATRLGAGETFEWKLDRALDGAWPHASWGLSTCA